MTPPRPTVAVIVIGLEPAQALALARALQQAAQSETPAAGPKRTGRVTSTAEEEVPNAVAASPEPD